MAITSCISLSSLILSKNRTISIDIQTTLLNSLLRFGRKNVLFGGSVLLSITHGVLAFAPSWPVFLVLFFMAGVNQIPSYLAGFVLGTFWTIFSWYCHNFLQWLWTELEQIIIQSFLKQNVPFAGSEILSGFPRVLFTSLCLPFLYVFGIMLLPSAAYLVRHWRHLSLLLAVPGLAYLPLWW